MRDSVGRALHAWEPGVPDYPFVLGIQAFALEECGDYARAEEKGRSGVCGPGNHRARRDRRVDHKGGTDAEAPQAQLRGRVQSGLCVYKSVGLRD